ncbi:MAG: gamma-glutamyltransferase [Betaproteobacteria bacterium]|nr:gamma-glutamyltransferase [Betaproteobacteria bacterium]
MNQGDALISMLLLKAVAKSAVRAAMVLSCLVSSAFASCDQSALARSRVEPAEASMLQSVRPEVDPSRPEPSSGFRRQVGMVTARSYMVVTAHPLASKVGCEVLRDGGSAIDAAVAVQMVLGLVEPQSSGIGGGGFLIHFDASSKQLVTYDGRETAPAAANEDYLRFISTSDKRHPLPTRPTPWLSLRASGRSIGIPGMLRMLELAHRDHGLRPWRELFDPAIQLAHEGFTVNGRMAAAILSAREELLRDVDAVGYFLNDDLSPKAMGTTVRNPAYAATLESIASHGADAFYIGSIAQSIVNKVAEGIGGPLSPVPVTPGLMTVEDLANYKAIRREPVCISYRNTWVCGMGPPSSGGIAVGQILGILGNFDLSHQKPTQIGSDGAKHSVTAAHLISEAQRLAYADRNKYVADTDFVPLPALGLSSLLNSRYLKERASLISMYKSIGTAKPGSFTAKALGMSSQEDNGTTHMTIVDRQGNVVSMTSSIEGSMGSYRLVRGFLLNNQLTDFSLNPTDGQGAPIANKIEPNKRPRSSMAPTIVFAKASDGSRGDFLMATGSPGGPSIIQFVSKTLIGVIDWKLNAQEATAMVNLGAANSPTTAVGGEHPYIDRAHEGMSDPLIKGLLALGHKVSLAEQSSGVATIVKTMIPGQGSPVYTGGADPRREGVALGD